MCTTRGALVRASAIYEGSVRHQRPGRGGHSFDQEVRMALIDLDAVSDLCRLHPLWSAHLPAPVWVRRADYLGDPEVPLAIAVRDLVESRTGTRPAGPITLLTNPRTWGWLFNPISCYFCFDREGTLIEHMVAEVTNTPWHERHCYVVGPPGTHRLTKAMHVSPFLEMGLEYRLDYSEPRTQFAITFTVSGPDGPHLYAGMKLTRRVADRSSLGHLVWSPRGGTIGVSMGIYRQALALWRKGVCFHPHPPPVPHPVLEDLPGNRTMRSDDQRGMHARTG
ncbi:MAG TPA: DUF1365 domain-containing protein [Acidimicrobiales bacterium]